MGPKRSGVSVWLCTIGSYGPYLRFELWQQAAREAQRLGRETGAFTHIEAMHYQESFGTLGMAMRH